MILVLLTVAAVGIFAAGVLGMLVGFHVDHRRYRVPEHPAMRPYRARRLRLIEGGKRPYDWQTEEGA